MCIHVWRRVLIIWVFFVWTVRLKKMQTYLELVLVFFSFGFFGMCVLSYIMESLGSSVAQGYIGFGKLSKLALSCITNWVMFRNWTSEKGQLFMVHWSVSLCTCGQVQLRFCIVAETVLCFTVWVWILLISAQDILSFCGSVLSYCHLFFSHLATECELLSISWILGPVIRTYQIISCNYIFISKNK